MTKLLNAGGLGWRVDGLGFIWLEKPFPLLRGTYFAANDANNNTGLLRSLGEPSTMRLLRAQYGDAIKAASERFQLPESWIAAMVTIEAGRVGKSLEMDRFSLRDEDGRAFAHYESRPNRVSAGLMQTLLATAREMAKRYDLQAEFAGANQEIDVGHLCVPATSLLLGAAYMRNRADRFGFDPVLLVGAYNAGGVYDDKKSLWRIRTYGETRIPKFVAYHNDWIQEFGK